MDTLDRLLDGSTSIIAKAEIKTSSSTKILQAMDKFAISLGAVVAMTGNNTAISRKNVGLGIVSIERNDIKIFSEENKQHEIAVSISTQTSQTFLKDQLIASILIPKETFKDQNQVVFSYCYRYSSLFMGENMLTGNTESLIENTKFVQSSVLSASTIAQNPVSNLKKSIQLQFKKMTSPNATGINSCKFWEFTIGK